MNRLTVLDDWRAQLFFVWIITPAKRFIKTGHRRNSIKPKKIRIKRSWDWELGRKGRKRIIDQRWWHLPANSRPASFHVPRRVMRTLVGQTLRWMRCAVICRKLSASVNCGKTTSSTFQCRKTSQVQRHFSSLRHQFDAVFMDFWNLPEVGNTREPKGRSSSLIDRCQPLISLFLSSGFGWRELHSRSRWAAWADFVESFSLCSNRLQYKKKARKNQF